MDADQGESIHFWQTPPLAGVELLSARYIDHRFAPHVHDGYVIGMIMAGAQRYRYRGAEHLAGSGTLVLINPDELHTGHKGTEDGWLYRAFYPDSGQMTSLLAELELPTHHLPAFGATLYRDQDLVNGFCQLHRLLESPATALQQQTVWRELVLSLLQRHAAVPDAGKPGKEHRAVSLAKELLQAQLTAPPSLEALAAAVNLSPFHFARVFRRATGMPPHTWLMQQRIARARALLQSGCLPLDVAMQLGFADQSHLSRQFKQVYGVGPGAYRSARL
jgi:AraC-like DNA-binding protein